MLPSRKIAAAFLGVFLIGMTVGVLLIWTFQDMRLSRFFTSSSDPKSWAGRINQKYLREYSLTPEEQARIAPLTDAMTQRLYILRHQFGTDVIATLDEYHDKIAAQMTPEHRLAFQKDNEDRRQRMSALLLPENTPSPAPSQP